MNEEDDLQELSEKLDSLPNLHFEDDDSLPVVRREEHSIPTSVEKLNLLHTVHNQDDNLKKSSEKLDSLPNLLHCEEDYPDSDVLGSPIFNKGTAVKMYYPEMYLHEEKNHHNYDSTLTPNTMTSETECPTETGHNCLQTKREQFDELRKDEYRLSKDTIDGSGDNVAHNIVIGLQENKLLKKAVSNVPQLHESKDIQEDKILHDRNSIGQETARLGMSLAHSKRNLRPESERTIIQESLDLHTFLIVKQTGKKGRLRVDNANSGQKQTPDVKIKRPSKKNQVEETEFVSVSSVKKKEQNKSNTHENQNEVEQLVTLTFELEVQIKKEQRTFQGEQMIDDERFFKCTDAGQDRGLKTTDKESDKQNTNILQILQVEDRNVPKWHSLMWLDLFKDSTITVFPVQNGNSKQISKGEIQKIGREEERTAQNDDPNRETHTETLRSDEDCIRNIVETENNRFLTLSADNGENSSCFVPSGQGNLPNDLPMPIGRDLPVGSILVPSEQNIMRHSSIVVLPGHNSLVRISRSVRVIDRPQNYQIQNHPVVPSQGSEGIMSTFFNMRMTNLCPILPPLLAISLWQREEGMQRLFKEASENPQLRNNETAPYGVLRQIAMYFNSPNPDFGRGVALWVRLVRPGKEAVGTEMTTYDMYSNQHRYVTSEFKMDFAVNCNGASCTQRCHTLHGIILPALRPNMSFNDLLWEHLQYRCSVCGGTASIALRYRTPLLFFNLARHPFSSSQDIPSCIYLPIEGINRQLRYRRILVTFHRDSHFIGLIWLHTERCLALYDCNDIHPSNPQYGVLRHFDYDPPGATMQLAVFALEDTQEDNSIEFLYS